MIRVRKLTSMRIIATLFILFTTPIFAADLVGVPKVDSADTFILEGQKLRLFGVNAPGKRQYCADGARGVFDCGARAQKFLKDLVRRAEISCDIIRPGTSERLGTVTCVHRGVDLGLTLIRAGYAQAELTESGDYATAQKEAFFAGEGLWAFDYAPLEVVEDPASARGRGCDIKGNISKTGRLYHDETSRWYGRTTIAPEFGERWFCSTREAQSAGWRAPGG